MLEISNILGDIPSVSVGTGEAVFRMSRGSFRCRDRKSSWIRDLPLSEKTETGWVLRRDGAGCAVRADRGERSTVLRFEADSRFNRLELSLRSVPDEKFYGCGEQFTHLNLKGQTVPIWVSEHQNATKIAKKCIREMIFGVNPGRKAKYSEHQTYYASPCFLSSRLYAVIPDTGAYAEYSFGDNRTVLLFHEIPKSITILFADSFEELTGRVAKYWGIPLRIPDWVGNGAIIAVQGGSDAVREKVRTASKHGVALAGVWSQDWSGRLVTSFGHQVFWNWAADETLYPGLRGLIEELHGKGIRFLGYINTFLKEDTPLYSEAERLGYLVRKKNRDGEMSVYLIQSTTFNAGIVDLTDPDAAEWYKSLIKNNLIAYGLDGWMADFGEYLPTDAVISKGHADAEHNAWPTMWAKTNRDAISECGKDSDIFIFNRAAYGTTLPYTGSVWCGDQHVDFSDEYGLGSVIPAMLSMGCVGAGITHSDIGGYTTIMHMKRSAELLIRWAELSAFTPVFRCHEGNRPQDNVQFSDDGAIGAFASLSRLFAALRPYRDSVMDEYYADGIPCARPMFFYDDAPWCYTCQDQYFFGRDLLVSPVLRPGVSEKPVRFPRGEWVQMFTGREFLSENGDACGSVDTPLGQPVVFYRKDSAFAGLFASLKI